MLISVAQYAALLGRKFTGDGSFCPISFASLGRANPDQLAFCVGVAPRLLLPMLVTKLSGAAAAAILVMVYTSRKKSLS